MDIKILVATHKKYDMPSDYIYLPIHVGREGKQNLVYQGDNISLKNPSYCELIGLYWDWNNLDYDVIRLSHYRRYFTNKSNLDIALNKNNKIDLILKKDDIKSILSNIFIMKKELFEEYCEWLFTILFELEKIVDISRYDTYQSRLYGFISERLFNIWILKKDIRLTKTDDINVEDIKWSSKIIDFIKRKFFR